MCSWQVLIENSLKISAIQQMKQNPLYSKVISFILEDVERNHFARYSNCYFTWFFNGTIEGCYWEGDQATLHHSVVLVLLITIRKWNECKMCEFLCHWWLSWAYNNYSPFFHKLVFVVLLHLRKDIISVRCKFIE